MSTQPPLSDMQMAAVLHGSPAPEEGPYTALVDRAMASVQVWTTQALREDRMGGPVISGYLDQNAPATLGGFMAVALREPRGWYAIRETHGGGQGMWAGSLEEALAKLREVVTQSVAYWMSLVELDPATVVRMKGEHYVLGPEPRLDRNGRAYRDGLGFGGHRWEMVELATGRHVVSHNLWRQGVIPVEMRPVMPDTHELAVTLGPDELHAHYVRRMWPSATGSMVVSRPLVTEPTSEERAAYRSLWDGLA